MLLWFCFLEFKYIFLSYYKFIISRIVGQILKLIKFEKNQIDEIIFVWGSIKIPKIREIIKKHFNAKKSQNINEE